ncbi:hypothetical protein KbCgl_05820 [Corynebacterium glutamicum]|nr:hypothetical protein KbCgl_05820 [Corynebacterium glutamicum]
MRLSNMIVREHRARALTAVIGKSLGVPDCSFKTNRTMAIAKKGMLIKI